MPKLDWEEGIFKLLFVHSFCVCLFFPVIILHKKEGRLSFVEVLSFILSFLLSLSLFQVMVVGYTPLAALSLFARWFRLL